MRRFLLAIASFALLLTGCTADITTDNGIVNEYGVTTLTLSTQATRTSLGGKENETYPIYWSEGDKIAVNGVLSSEATIDAADPTSAKFTINEKLSYPYAITYPYTSTTTAEAPKVTFLAEQEYCEGSFCKDSAPLCGYAAKSGDDVAISHLATVLRFQIKGATEGTILDKVVITSKSAALAGEFAVNCSRGTLAPSQNNKNSVTYTLPDNFVLSTESESVFYISIPAIEVGNCVIEFVETSGKKMICSWEGKSIKAGVVKEFKSITYKRGTSGALAPLEVEEDYLIAYYPTIVGYVKDSNGKPISGVAVSDGFSVVSTNSKGYYKLDNVTKDCRYIYISVPAEYEVPINEFGQPCFYKPYPGASNQFDFTLTPLAGGKEKTFALFTFADPQVSTTSALKRLNSEAIPEIFDHCSTLEAQGIPCYGITLGDIISNSDSNNTGAMRDDLRDAFDATKTGMPVFQVMGNHDNSFCNKTQPLLTDERTSTFALAAQREHEDMFGPVNYSFNRGDVHIIGMRDIVYPKNTSGSGYSTGFLPAQLEWLKQDLALVPKDKMVVLCVHIQLFNGTSNHIQDVLSLLDQYKEAHVLSGHTHRQQLYDHTTKSDSSHKVYEHNTCAVCGAWWSANIAGDGTPNGYNVFISNSSTFSDWYYMGYNKGMNDRSHQMRLYRGNAVTGGPIEGTNTSGVKGYYAFNFAEDVLLANVYNADTKWKIEVYEDGVYSGDMTLIPTSAPSFSSLVGDYTYESPRQAEAGLSTSVDFYVTGLAVGILNRYSSSSKAPSNGAYCACTHLYKYNLKNKEAQIKVVATDCFGNKYTETKITEGTDYSLAKKPQ